MRRKLLRYDHNMFWIDFLDEPLATRAIRDVLAKLRGTIPVSKDGVPKLSGNALAFLWHSTASGGEAYYSKEYDWACALGSMVEWKHGEPVYNPDWPAVIELLRHTPVREAVKCAGVLNWFGRGAREVPFELKADFARIFLPAYRGPSLTLYRGCAVGNERQHYWTTRKSLARKFAYSEGSETRTLVSVRAAASAIICDLRPFFRDYSEIVVDPSLLPEVKVLERAAGSSFCDRAHRFYADDLQRNSFRDRMKDLRRSELRHAERLWELQETQRALSL